MSRELKLRIISAVILGTITLVDTWIGGVFFAGLVIIVGFLLFYEWSNITRTAKRQPLVNFIGWLTLTVVSISILFSMLEMALLSLGVGALLAAAMGWGKAKNLWVFGGIAYSGLPIIAFTELRGDETSGFYDQMGLFAIVFVFVIVWATDIFAYFCGKSLGGPKLAPSISPGKTWSGAIFGLVAGVGAGIGVVLLISSGGGYFVPILAVVLSISSQVGDLFESWIKRRFGVKDSSNLIPGHGGFMDRLDGMIFASVAAFLIALLDQFYAGTDASHVLAIHLLGL